MSVNRSVKRNGPAASRKGSADRHFNEDGSFKERHSSMRVIKDENGAIILALFETTISGDSKREAIKG